MSLTKDKDSITPLNFTDPCASEPVNPGVFEGILGDPSTYYIAGLIAIIIVCSITTVLIALDQNKVE
jgi:hypothetical protein